MRLALILAACILALAALTACSKADPPTPASTAGESQLCSIYYAHSHMNRYKCFHFELYQDDGKVLFSGHCAGYDGQKEYEYAAESVEVPAQELQNVQVILAKHNTKDFLKNYRRPLKTYLDVKDAPSTTFHVRWSDTKSLEAKSTGEAGADLEAYFRQLAAKYGKSKQ